MNNKRMNRGFTLIELMIVVAIIGILAAIAIPKFSNLIVKSNEAATKGSLGAIRSALTIYYADMEGWYPSDTLATLATNQKYLSAIPISKLPRVSGLSVGHSDSAAVTASVGNVDAGGWVYDNTSTDPSWGRVMIACTHSDTRGSVWTSF